MSFLDIKSILIGNMLMDLLCTGLLLMLWRQYRDRYHGLGFLSLDFALQTISMLLIVLRVIYNSPLMIISSSIFMFAGIIAGLEGSRRFVSRQGRHLPNLLLITGFVPLQYYLIISGANVEWRSLLVSIVILLLLSQNAWLFLFGVPEPAKAYTRPAGIMFALYCTLSLVRILKYLLFPEYQEEYLVGRLFEEIILFTYQVLFVMLAMSLLHMVNKRLTIDIHAQEEKFAKAFQSSPYAILLTRMTDGLILEVNEGFTAISGYRADEVVGKKSTEVCIWNSVADRIPIIEELAETTVIDGRELPFHHKNGSVMTGLLYARLLQINGENVILSSISDITRRKAMETDISRLLADKEVLLREIHHRVKNNMMTVSSLLSLQAKSSDNKRGSGIID
jgi:PAS domain S-box-containing protein